MNTSVRRTAFVTVALVLGGAFVAAAQPPAGQLAPPAFSLASSHIATSKERPAVMLTFRRVTSLDFRVYRVKDPLAFFAKLRDPHVLGSEEPVVPQERTWIERIATWKADRRDDIRSFVRGQLSYAYRAARRETVEREQVQRRQTVRYGRFAQVPLLNAAQLVSSWREILPPVRETEARRIPLDLAGAGVYVVEAVNPPLRAYTVVMVSDVGLVTKTAPGQIVVFAANRFSGEPAGGCDIRTISNRQVVASGTTDEDGLYELRFEGRKLEDVVAVVRCGTEVAATDPSAWDLNEPSRELVGYLYTDKPIYRPGHTVRLKGVLRWRTRGALVPFDRKQVELVITDSNDKVLQRQSLAVDEFGAVHASFPVSAGAALGIYAIRLNSGDDRADGGFEVQEYRKPDFEVTVRPVARFVVQDGKAVATITARYYFGQPVAGAAVRYVVHRQPYYSQVRWAEEGEEEESSGGWWGGGKQEREGTARLDDQGTAVIEVPAAVDQEGRDYSVRIEARVTDASSREVAGNTIIHATYGRFLVTARVDQYVYKPGSPVTLIVRALDYEGTPQAGTAVAVWMERLTYERGRWEAPSVTRLDESSVSTDAEGRARWTAILPSEPGEYRLKASARFGDRAVQDDAYAWVPGRAVDTLDEEQQVELVADKKAYQPGDVARFTFRDTGYGVPALVTKESQSVSYRRVARLKVSDAIEVPIGEDDCGDTYVNVAFLKDDRLYRAEKRVKVPAVSRQLQVTVTPDEPVSRPRQQAGFTLRVVDAAGRPVRAQLSLGVIDEAVYGVKPDETPDPLRFFYRREYSRVGTQFSRDYSFIGYSGTEQIFLAQRRRPLTLADFKAERPLQPQVRKEFPDAIFWIGNLVTDASGMAHVKVPYPDSLTTWRLTARAVTADAQVGGAVARTTTTKDLIIQVVTPRFLTEGDAAAIPVIVHNYLPGTKSVAVSLEATGVAPGPTAPSDRQGAESPRTVSIEQGGDRRLDWPVTADRVGTATFTGTAVTDTARDGVEVSIPVLPFGLKRQIGAAGSIVGTGEQSAELAIPETSNPSVRTIRVSLASSLAGPLLGALDFLTSYPYGCTEQTLSSFLPNLLVLRALSQLKIAPTERLQALDRQVTQGLGRLYDYQHDDGGWGWWKTDQSSPFMTAYAVYGLIEAKQAGYRIQEWSLTNGARGLARLYATYPRAVPDLKIYMAYVLGRAAAASVTPGTADADSSRFDLKVALNDSWASRQRMSAYGRALLLLALDATKDGRGDQLAREIADSVQRKGDLAWWTSDDDPILEDFGDTSVEATAFVVKALVARDARNPLLEPAVRWLLVNRNFGAYWSSTKQTAMVLYGLLDFMRARGEGVATTTVDIVVNGTTVGSHTFDAGSLTSPDPIVITAPGKPGANSVRVATRGGGAVYWSATAEFFDQAGSLERTGSRKLALVRTYYSLTPVQRNGRTVYHETPFDGTTKPGDLLLVRLTAAGSTDWRHLMIEDPLPAGVEAVDERQFYELERPQLLWDGSRREYRDEQLVFFQESFTAGRYEYEYLLKVTTPGRFRAMPARISAMYVPEASASSDAQSLVVGADAPRPPGTVK